MTRKGVVIALLLSCFCLWNEANAETIINTKDGLMGSRNTITVNFISNVTEAQERCRNILSGTRYKCGKLVTFVKQSKWNELYKDYAIFELVY